MRVFIRGGGGGVLMIKEITLAPFLYAVLMGYGITQYPYDIILYGGLVSEMLTMLKVCR